MSENAGRRVERRRETKCAFMGALGALALISPFAFYLVWAVMLGKPVPEDITLLNCLLAGVTLSMIIFLVSGHVKQQVFLEIARLIADKFPSFGRTES